MPASIVSVDENAFYGCSAIEKAEFANVASLCATKFGNASANPLSLVHRLRIDDEEITDLVIPDGVTTIEDYAFCGFEAMTSVSIANTVTKIGDYAFAYCNGLKTVEIPESVDSLGNGSFCYCTALTSIDVPDGISSIGYHAFGGCSSATTLSLPRSVSAIGELAFEGCVSLQDVYCFAVEAPAVNNVFDSSIVKATLHVPAESVDLYQSDAVWGRFARIVAMGDDTDGINSIDNNLTIENVDAIYDLNGRRISRMQRGVNIIRYTNGTSRKLFVR